MAIAKKSTKKNKQNKMNKCEEEEGEEEENDTFLSIIGCAVVFLHADS